MHIRFAAVIAIIAFSSCAGFPALAHEKALAIAVPAPPAPPAAPHPVVIELFTSQGCSDCPPADQFLTELAKRKDVIALTLPVTYWDMLGWKDTFASEHCTARQEAYAKMMGKSGVYTPQIIIDGIKDVVGGRRDDVLAAIAEHAAKAENVAISVKTSPDYVKISIGGAHDQKNGADATIWVMHTLAHADVHVGDGENKGRELAYTNVVRDLKAIGLWKGNAETFDLPRAALSSVKHDGIVVIVQRDSYGQVIGATMIPTSDKR